MLKRIFTILAAVIFAMTAMPLNIQADESAPVLNLLKDTAVTNSAVSFKIGNFGTSVNGQTFQNEAVITFNGWQYATYWKDIRTGTFSGAPKVSTTRLAVARRQLPDGNWEEILIDNYWPDNYHFEGYDGVQDNGNVHNVAVIGISGDGVIHLSFDHHVSGLRYIKSVQGAATNPSSVTWDRALFGDRTSALIDGAEISEVAYPLFIPMPDGGLNFIFRVGYSGQGRWNMYEYTSDEGSEYSWKVVGRLFSDEGTYTPPAGQGNSSPGRCAYPNQFRYDSNNRLHATWVWRENGTNRTGNHDLCYAYSDDFGRTWKNNAGETIATLNGELTNTNAISINSDGHVVYPIKYNWGMQNQGTMYLDYKNRPHTVLTRNPDDAPSTSNNIDPWRYYHYWRDDSGVWQEQRLPFWGRKPQTMMDDDGNLYVLFGQWHTLNYDGFDYGTVLSIARATEATGWTDWKLTHVYPEKIFHGEPLFDITRWREDGILSVYFQEKPDVAGMPSNLRVIDFEQGESAELPVVEVGFEFPIPPDPWDSMRNLTQAVIDDEGETIIPAATVIGFSAQQTGDGDSNNLAIKLIDGDLGDPSVATGTNRWAAEGFNPPDGQWVLIDLGANKKIRETRMHPISGRKYRFHVEAWKDGETSADAVRIVDRTSQYDVPRPITNTFEPHHEARYVKFTVTDRPHDVTTTWVAIREFEIWGLDIEPDALTPVVINTLKAVNKEGHIILVADTNTAVDSDYVIHAVVYDQAGTLLKHVKVPILDDVPLDHFYVVLDEIPDAQTVKVFIWESFENMIPASNTKTVEITT